MTPFEDIIAALEARGCRVRRSGRGSAMCQCPAHDDRNPSLSIKEGDDGRVILNCFAGCTCEEVAGAMGRTVADLFADRPYDDSREAPRRVASKRQEDLPEPLPTADELSGWRTRLLESPRVLDRLKQQRGWTPSTLEQLGVGFDGERLVFPISDQAGQLTSLARYLPGERTHGAQKMLVPKGRGRDLFPPPEALSNRKVWVGEGEGDGLSLHEMGLPGVGVPGVAFAKPTRVQQWAPRLAGRDVVMCFDADEEGRQAAAAAAPIVAQHAAKVQVVDVGLLDPDEREGFDITDLLVEAGPDDARRFLIAAAKTAPVITAPLPETAADVSPDGVSLTPYSAIEPENVEWLWPDRIPLGMLTLLVGDPGLGKSMLTAWLAAQVTTGKLGGAAGNVLLVTAEDSPSATVRPRLEVAAADLGRVFDVTVRREGMPEGIALPDDAGRLAEMVERVEAKLLVIDPLMAHLPEAVNSFKDQSVRRALTPLYRLADSRGTTVLIVAHLNKATGSDPLLRIGGSVAIPGACRSGLLLARDPDDSEAETGPQRVLAHFKCNVGPLAPSLAWKLGPAKVSRNPPINTARIELVGESDHTGRALLGVQLLDEERSTIEDAKEFLRIELADGPVSSKDIKRTAKDAGFSDRTLERAKGQLQIRSERTGFSKDGHWTWALPEGCSPKAANAHGGLCTPTTVADYADSVLAREKQAVESNSDPHRPPSSKSGDQWTDAASAGSEHEAMLERAQAQAERGSA